jgi:hypothetical protein
MRALGKFEVVLGTLLSTKMVHFVGDLLVETPSVTEKAMTLLLPELHVSIYVPPNNKDKD